MSGSTTSGIATDGSFFESNISVVIGPISLSAGSSENQIYLGDATNPAVINLGLATVLVAVQDNDSLNDSAWGGAGDDQLHGMGGNDTLLGNGGNDVIYGELGPVDFGSLLQVQVSNIIGSPAGDDSLDGGAGNDTIDGQLGNDTIIGGAGDDVLTGGGGEDWLDYRSSSSGVSIDLGAGTASDGLGGTDAFSGFENVVLGSTNDIVVGGAGNQVIDLGDGDDSYAWAAGDGDDTIYLGDGNDTLDLTGWTSGGGDWSTVAGSGGSVVFSNATNNLTVFGFDAQNDSVTCFAAGTMIATDRGEVPVERLRAGDLVLSLHQGPRLVPLRWVGRTRIDVARQRNKAAVAPVLIRAGALADGVPTRDLRVSPEHAILLDGGLVPAHRLVNGESIIQESWCGSVTYYHLEIEGHGLLVSDGAVTESYCDDGNRALFDNAAVVPLAVDFVAQRGRGRYADLACAPVIDDGAALDRIRLRLALRAGRNERAA